MTVELVSDSNASLEWSVNQLTDFKGRFDQILKNFLDNKIAEASEIRPELGRMLEVCSDFVIGGGKRLRPAFVYFGWKAAGGTGNEDTILQAAIPMELVHAGALVHDDVMDNSDSRRGKPTVHKIFEKEMGGEEVGRSLAIVAGDMILALADEAMSAYPSFGGRYQEARQCFDEMCKEINFGQHLDVVGNLLPEVSEEWIMLVMRYKTAGYTVEKPLLVGAILGGASEKVLKGLSEYGIKLGIAFQIKDDILGMFGSEKKVGKPVDSDLKEGKKTLLVSKTFEKLSAEGRKEELGKFKSILGNHKLTENDYEWCQNLMRETGAVDYCQQLVEKLTEEAAVVLKDVEIDSEARRFLLGISEFLVAREY